MSAAPTRVTASDLADIAADRLTRLAEDLAMAAEWARSSTPQRADTAAFDARALADDRNEAAGALERLVEALSPDDRSPVDGPSLSARAEARQQVQVIRNALGIANDPRPLRRWAAAWRAYAAAPVGEGQAGA